METVHVASLATVHILDKRLDYDGANENVHFAALCEWQQQWQRPARRRTSTEPNENFKLLGEKICWRRRLPRYQTRTTPASTTQLKRQSRAEGAVQLRAEEREVANSWRTLLRNRTKIMEPLDDEEAQKYRGQCRDERRITEVCHVLQAQEDGDDSWCSDVASAFEKWCVEKSWVMCAPRG